MKDRFWWLQKFVCDILWPGINQQALSLILMDSSALHRLHYELRPASTSITACSIQPCPFHMSWAFVIQRNIWFSATFNFNRANTKSHNYKHTAVVNTLSLNLFLACRGQFHFATQRTRKVSTCTSPEALIILNRNDIDSVFPCTKGFLWTLYTLCYGISPNRATCFQTAGLAGVA